MARSSPKRTTVVEMAGSSGKRTTVVAVSRSERRCRPVPLEVRQAADLLERRWQLSIIYAALTGALRWGEFAEAVDGISPRMLSERLRDLEAAGLIERVVLPTSPPTVEYRLTERGRRLGPLIEAMRAYAESIG